MNMDNVKTFSEALFLANTPEYFLVKAIGNPRLDTIIKESSVADLFSELDRANNDLTISSSSQLKGYVALAALLKISERDISVLSRLQSYSTAKLRWLGAIVGYWDAIRRPTSVESVSFARAVSPDSFRVQSSSTSNVNNIVMTGAQ